VRLPLVAPAPISREPSIDPPRAVQPRTRDEVLSAARREVDRVRAERAGDGARDAGRPVAVAGAANST
jgi:hypothetical protein